MITLPCPVCGDPPLEPTEVQYEGEPTVVRCINDHEYGVDEDTGTVYEIDPLS